MRIRRTLLQVAVAALCIVAVVFATNITAGSANFDGRKPTFESVKLGTAANGQPVANTYEVLSINDHKKPICDLVITLEDTKGNKIPADANNKIAGVSVQRTTSGNNNGAPANYVVAGQTTQAKIDLNPCIDQSIPGNGGVTKGAKIVVSATTNKDFVRIHITTSFAKANAAGVKEHFGMAGEDSGGAGSIFSLSVPVQQNGTVFFIKNPAGAPEPVRRGWFRIVGSGVPMIESVTVEDASNPFAVEIDNTTHSFRLSNGDLVGGDTMTVWVKFQGVVNNDAALLGRLMAD